MVALQLGHDKALSECGVRTPSAHSAHVQRISNSIGMQDFKYKMMSVHKAPPSITKLELRTAYGSVFRDVLSRPPRDCTPEEIPVIDLSCLYSNKLEDHKSLARDIRAAAVNTGFFYIKNHGIEAEKIANAKKQLLACVKRLHGPEKWLIRNKDFSSSPSQRKIRFIAQNPSILMGGGVQDKPI